MFKQNFHQFSGLALIWLFLIFMMPVHADVLSIPDDGGATQTDVVTPPRGMSMDEVSSRFGQPTQVIDPVGTPPITRWEYEHFTVHFEYEYVIHSVVKSPSKQ